MEDAEDEHKEYFGEVLTITKGMNIISQDEWILDSGYPVHIFFRKEIFDFF